MNESVEESQQEAGERDAPPQFGLIDLVDAFTAFRHEYRTQLKESRTTNENLLALAAQMERLADRLTAEGNERGSAAPAAEHKLLLSLIELDIQWTRAVEAATRSEEYWREQAACGAAVFERAVEQLSPFRRWLAAPLIRAYRHLQSTHDATALPTTRSSMADGLGMVLARLRATLDEFGIQRVETHGQPFDGNLMRSIGVVNDSRIAAGHVAQQLSPAYLGNGKVLKFADVRVAATDATSSTEL